MAITRSQQAKQMLQDGGMLVKPGFGGKRQGYRGEGGYQGGRSDTPAGASPAGDVDRSKTTTAQDANQRAQVRAGNVRTVENLINRPTFGFTDAAKYNIAPPGIRALQSLFTGPNREFNPATRDGRGETPLWMQLGYSSEAEYNAAMAGGASPSEPAEPAVDLNRIAYRLMADGGAVMDDEPRQAYGIGSLVKKAKKVVKKIVKSDIGKAALLYAATGGFGNLAQGQSFFTNFTSPTTFLGGARNIFTKKGLANIGSKIGLGSFENVGGNRIFQKNLLGKIVTSPGAGITALSALPFFMGAKEEDEEERELPAYLTEGLDIPENQYRLLAEGGSTEEKEPVAKKVMPLLDMDGMEKDYRAEGGFVPIGRMEKADDVPARLSKNEFVFTADAVRNAGDGSVDKGAEVMYNMMKNLEAGGEVSEESQGLEGARKMFQTSQRLEEVL